MNLPEITIKEQEYKNLIILVIGEYCQDHYIYGDVTRISPEAPIPVFIPKDTIINDGMAANVYNNLKSLSSEEKVAYYHPKSIIKKTRFVDSTSGYSLLRVDENDSVPECNTNEIIQIITDNLNTLKAVVISDYNKGFLPKNEIYYISLVCKEYNILTFLDTKKIFTEELSEIDFIKINEKEYNAQGDNSLYAKNLIVTLGVKGSLYVKTNEVVATKEVEVRDVAGAGDTYLAGFVTEYLETKDIYIAMKFANDVASFAVSKKGIVTVKKSDLK